MNRIIQPLATLRDAFMAVASGVWEWDLIKGKEYCSVAAKQMLGYATNEWPDDPAFFESRVITEDLPLLQLAQGWVYDSPDSQHQYELLVRCRHFDGSIRTILRRGEVSERDAHGYPVRLTGVQLDVSELIDREEYIKKISDKLEKNEFMLNEAGRMAKMGGWEVDMIKGIPKWSKEVYAIHEVPLDYQSDLESAINFYHPDSIPVLTAAIEEMMRSGKSYDLELKFITAKNNEIWVRTKGEAMRNEKGEVVGMRGIFQDINEKKLAEIALTESLNALTIRNKQLDEFAHIVSHNLRNHTGNLEMMLRLFEYANSVEEKDEYIQIVRGVSDRLSETIGYLSEIVKMRTSGELERQEHDLEHMFNKVKQILGDRIMSSGMQVSMDLEVKTIRYPGVYLESILQNLLSNAIKYREPSRQLRINMSTRLDQGKIILRFEDNGQGIDLQKHGHKIFGLYKTFHEHPEAHGVGLFLTKNQIEALGGSIHVESSLDKGTVFTIIF